MSQMQFQCPASPMPAAPAPLPLGQQQQQPGYSIPCASGTLQSESASQPGRSSALPAGSATAYSTTTESNMANPKEKTPMCLVNELARFNKIQPEYKLLSEEGPAHSKIFSVRLTLGDQHWEAEGTSIKKAQHSAAATALSETTLPKPTVRTPRPPGRIPDNMTHIIELNAICMKLGKKPMYKPLDPYPGMRPPNFNYNVRGPGPYQRSMQQYYYPFPPVGPVIYHMELSVGGQQFLGKGRTRQLAKHDAAAKALKVLQKEPMLQELSEMNGEEEDEEENLNKSEISQVFETALKRNLPVSFEVLKEDGPPHMKSFVVRVIVGQFTGEGEGKSKKIAKKLAAAAVLGELKNSLIFLVWKRLCHASKRKQNPSSRMGPSKKVAKRNAAEKMLELLGYKVPQPQPPKPALKTDEKSKDQVITKVFETGPSEKTWRWAESDFFEPGSVEEAANGIKEEDFRLSYMSHQQLPAGILPMVPEVAKAVGVCQGPQPNRTLPNPAKATVTAMIANELLYAGASPTAENILKNKNSLNQLPHGPLTRPSEQLGFLSAVQGLQVDYKDFPKNNKNEFVSLINCSAQPPLISHGIGKDVESCHDMAALNILKMLSELDQQANERTGNGPASGCAKQDMEDDLKPANSNTLAHTLDGTV
ncbi:hypothetical protein WMY93_012332 [Mugilogobius chulae]|uniref:Double-stranded RNA-binding protein Staufen homolog 1 n=1 Tax=Mugilogobius chulae TaxID=88201 RepID=A0AAW0P8C4_9GOBI